MVLTAPQKYSIRSKFEKIRFEMIHIFERLFMVFFLPSTIFKKERRRGEGSRGVRQGMDVLIENGGYVEGKKRRFKNEEKERKKGSEGERLAESVCRFEKLAPS